MTRPEIRICLSAYACDPTRGSEPGIGWNVARELARRYEVWVITRRKNEEAIARELARAPLPHLHTVYYDLPPAARIWKRGQLGIEVYYRLWQSATRRLAERLHHQVRFDLAQHATFGRYWGPASLATLPVPFVWGPVGGGESAPASFLRDVGVRGRAYEHLRNLARRSGEWDPAVRAVAQRAALGLAVTHETRERLMALGTRRVELFSAMGFQRTQFDSLARLPDPPHEPFRFVSIGRLLHWKGFQFGLRAFAAAALDAAEYWIVGAGPERARLERHARVLGVESRVRFCGALSRPETLARLAACHVLVHPSLHDSGGWVCLEAMAAGRPVICLDLGGPAEQVTDATGIKVPARHPEQAVADLALAMSSLARDSERRSALAAAARQRVEEEYLWEHKGERLDSLFAALLAPQHEGAVSPAYP